MDGCLKLYRNTNIKAHNRIIKNPRLSERTESTLVTNIETSRSTIDRVPKKPPTCLLWTLLVDCPVSWISILVPDFRPRERDSTVGTGCISIWGVWLADLRRLFRDLVGCPINGPDACDKTRISHYGRLERFGSNVAMVWRLRFRISGLP